MSRLGLDVRESTIVTSDGARLHVERIARGHATPLLLLHGGMGTLDDFAPLAHELPDVPLLALDARGHGASTLGSRALTYEQLQQDAIAVLDHFRLPQAIPLGFSDGGIVAYRLALHASERIDRLVTIGGPNRLSDRAGPLLEQVTAASWDAKFPETRQRYAALNPEPDFERFVTVSKAMWLDDSRATGYPGDAVSAIRQPTLIVRGDRDPLVSLDEAVELRRSIRNASLLHVPFAGHDPAAQVGIVAAAVRAFLEDAP